MHKHQCRGCGAVWQHSDLMMFAPADIHEAAHCCPVCETGDNKCRADKESAITCEHPVQSWSRVREAAEAKS